MPRFFPHLFVLHLSLGGGGLCHPIGAVPSRGCFPLAWSKLVPLDQAQIGASGGNAPPPPAKMLWMLGGGRLPLTPLVCVTQSPELDEAAWGHIRALPPQKPSSPAQCPLLIQGAGVLP